MNADLMDDDFLVRRYLLGELGEEERGDVEQRLLGDDDFFELAEAVEGDLLAACARNEVGPAERERIIRRLASSRTGHARLALAQALNHFGDTRTVTQTMRTYAEPLPFRRREPVHHRPMVVRFATLAASLAAAILAIALVAPKMPQGTGATLLSKVSGPVQVHGAAPLATPPAQTLTETSSRSPQATAAQTPPRPAPVVLVLAFSTLRSEGQPEAGPLRIPHGAQTVEIRMPVSEQETYRSYRVAVTDVATGAEVWRGAARRRTVRGESTVTVSLPAAAVLPAGRIEVELNGVGAGGELELMGSSVVVVQAQ